MRWTILFILITYIMCASSVAEAIRDKRSLSLLKRLLLSNFMSTNQKKCPEKSSNQKDFQSSKIFIVPGRHKLVVDAIPGIKKPKENNDKSILSSIRQYLTTGALQESSKVLREILTTLQSGVSNELETSFTDNVSDQSIYVVPKVTQTVKLKSLPIIDIPEIQTKFIPSTQTLNVLPSMVNFMSPIISMPRKYSYEQVKGDTVEKFTLDEDSNVLVTENRRPMLKRPAYIEDRFKEIIQSVPTTTSNRIESMNFDNGFQHVEQKELSPFVNAFKISLGNSPNPSASIRRDQMNSLINSVPKNYNNIAKVNTAFSMDTIKPHYIYNDGINELSLGDPETLKTDFANELHRHWYLGSTSETNPIKSQMQMKIQPAAISYNHPLNKYQELLTKISEKDVDISNNSNIPIRYSYKQQTHNGTVEFSNTSNVSFGEGGEKIDFKKVSNNNSFTGQPIIVSSLSDTLKTSNPFNHEENQENEVSEWYSNEKSRGDIPQSYQ